MEGKISYKMKSRSLIESFNYAVSGIIYTLKTEKNMRVHFEVYFLILLDWNY